MKAKRMERKVVVNACVGEDEEAGGYTACWIERLKFLGKRFVKL